MHSGREDSPDQFAVVHFFPLPSIGQGPYVGAMNLELINEKKEVLIRELSHIVQNDRYPLSPRIVAPKEILGMLRPEPERAAAAAPTDLSASDQGADGAHAAVR